MAAPQYALNQILQRLSDADSDFRFMALNDLLALMQGGQTSLAQDSGIASRVIDGVLKALDDSNGEVQNLAVKCLAPLSLRIKETQLSSLLERLAGLPLTATDPSIPATALRLIVVALPKYATPRTVSAQFVTAAQNSIQRVVLPKLLLMLKPGQVQQANGGVPVDAIDVLIDILRCFGDILQAQDLERLQAALLLVLETERCASVAKKRAVTALAILSVYASDDLLSKTISHMIMNLRMSHITPSTQKLLVSLTGALARTIPKRFGHHLKIIAPFIVAVVDGKDLEEQNMDDEPHAEVDELREGALAALDSFMAYCQDEMEIFTTETIDAGTRFLKYDPNYAPMDDDDEEMGGTQTENDDEDDGDFGDDEFEDDGEAFSDDDDISWKVRRSAAKLLSTVINTRADDLLNGVLYKDVAPLLVRRFEEREETVRIEVLATMTTLVRQTGELEGISQHPPHSIIPEKKKRRGSDISMMEHEQSRMEPSDTSSSKIALTKLIPRIGKACAKLLLSKSLSTKQATITLLSSIVTVSAGLSTILPLVLEPIIDTVRQQEVGGSVSTTSTTAGSAAVSSSTLRMDALKFLDDVFLSNTENSLRPFYNSLVDCLTTAVNDRFYKISSQALVTISIFVDKFAQEISQANNGNIQKIYKSINMKISQSDADLEVRERAIEAMGVVLCQTSGNQYLSQDLRKDGLNVILDRLRNETTRLTAARTIEKVAKDSQPDDLDGQWTTEVVQELGNQLRKANRALRGSSLGALRNLILNPATREPLSQDAAQDLAVVLTPLVSPNDFHLCGPALLILAELTQLGLQMPPNMVDALSSLGRSPLGGNVLSSLLKYVRAIGNKGQGKDLMANYLNLGTSGETAIVAKVIANLLVYGGSAGQRYSVSLEDFVSEAKKTSGEKNKCLALMVLGEAGLQMKGNFPVGPDIFFSQFAVNQEEVPVAAATALGLAAAGNPSTYLPTIMKKFQSGKAKDQYLLLHSYREIIQHSSENQNALKPFVTEIWQHLFVVSKNEENKGVAAECVGRLTVIDPASCIPGLQKALQDPEPATRAMVISAIRYTFTDTKTSFVEYLRPVVIQFLTAMIDDPVIENRKLALTTMNSAAHNKPYLIIPHLHVFLPKVYKETIIKPELVREVQMGPFKHKVDDGLDVRKHAYETLYAFLETAFSRMNVNELFDRILAGLADEHDIRVLCNLMLSKLVTLANEETAQRLDDIAEHFRTTITTKPKETAVKQELEKFAELTRSILRTSIVLQKNCPSTATQGPKWAAYYEMIKVHHKTELTALEKEENTNNAGGGTE